MNRKHLAIAVALLTFAGSFTPSKAQEAPKTEAIAALQEVKQGKPVNAIAVTPDGKLLASATADFKENKATSQVHLWSVADGKLQKTWEAGPVLITALAFSQDGKVLAVGVKGAITLWSREGQKQKTLTGHTRDIESMEFSPDGKTLASGSLRSGERNLVGELFLWDVTTGLKREILMEGPGGATAVAFSRDGTQIVATQSQFMVGVWDVETLQLKKSIGDEAARGIITAVAFSPDGRVIATGDMGHGLKLWDAQSGQLQTTLLKMKDGWNGLGPSGGVEGIVFGADGKTMVSAGTNQEGPGGEADLLVWSWPNPQLKHSLLPPPHYGISHFAASANGQVFATVESLSSSVKVWRSP
jgi:WD40 repeat protein